MIKKAGLDRRDAKGRSYLRQPSRAIYMHVNHTTAPLQSLGGEKLLVEAVTFAGLSLSHSDSLPMPSILNPSAENQCGISRKSLARESVIAPVEAPPS